MMQGQALDALAFDHCNRVHHCAADGQDFHLRSSAEKLPGFDSHSSGAGRIQV
jgi:hypothetical protein